MRSRMVNPNRYAGMAIGQRLFAAGLLEGFQRARVSRDRVTMIEMLMTVAVDDPGATADTFLDGGSEAFALAS